MGMYGSGEVGKYQTVDNKQLEKCIYLAWWMHGCTEAERWLAHMHAPADETRMIGGVYDYWVVI